MDHNNYKYEFVSNSRTNQGKNWRCTESANSKCPAVLKTEVNPDGKVVISKRGKHNHEPNVTSTPRKDKNSTTATPSLEDTPLSTKRKDSESSDTGSRVSTASDISQKEREKELSALIPVQSSEVFKIKYEEVHQLNNSLIDKIVEKEKKLWEQEQCIKELKAKIIELESSTTSNETANNAVHEELAEQKKLVCDMLTTVKVLEAALQAVEKGKDESSTVCKAKLHSSSKTLSGPSTLPATAEIVPQLQTKPLDPEKILIVGDSHVRRLSNILKEKLPSTKNVQSVFKGGSKIGQVLDLMEEQGASLSSGDTLVVFSGTCDVSQTSWNVIRRTYEEILTKYRHCKIQVILIPPRRGDHHLNPHITLINQKTAKFLADKNVPALNPLSVLKNGDYSPDGLHLNKYGKSKICGLIISQLASENPDGARRKSKKRNYKNYGAHESNVSRFISAQHPWINQQPAQGIHGQTGDSHGKARGGHEQVRDRHGRSRGGHEKAWRGHGQARGGHMQDRGGRGQALGGHGQARGGHGQARGGHMQALGGHMQARGSHRQARGGHMQARGGHGRARGRRGQARAHQGQARGGHVKARAGHGRVIYNSDYNCYPSFNLDLNSGLDYRWLGEYDDYNCDYNVELDNYDNYYDYNSYMAGGVDRHFFK